MKRGLEPRSWCIAQRIHDNGATLDGIEWLMVDAEGTLVKRPLMH